MFHFWSFSLYVFLKSANRHIQNARENSLAVQWLGLQAFTAWTQVQSLVEELRSRMPYGVAKKGGKMSRGLPQELPHKDENFIISRKKLFLRESHVSWERQHHLKTLPFMDTEKQRIFA